jgi:HAMP domain-containing protein
MTVEKRLKAGTGIPLVIFLIFSVIFYLQVCWIGRCINQVTEVEVPRCRAASSMEIKLVGIGFELLGYLQDPNPEGIDWIGKYKKDFRENQSIYCRLTETEEGKLSAVAIDKDIAMLWKVIEELINLQKYQTQRLSLLHEKLEEVDKVSSEGFRDCTESEERCTFDELKPFMEMRIWSDDIEKDISYYLTTHQKGYEERIYKSQRDFGRFLDGYKKSSGVLPQEAWLEQLCKIHADIGGLIGDVVALEEKKEARKGDFVETRERLRSILGTDVEQAHANFETASRKSYKAVAISTAVTLVLVLVGLAVALVSQGYIAYSVALPIAELRDAAAKISQGQYDTRIEIESDDEIRQLAESINKMAQEFRESGASLSTSGEETAECEKAGMSS